MKKVYQLSVFVLLGMLLISCESKTYSDLAGEVANPTYNANVKGIMQNNCVGCHNATYNQEPYLETYNEVKNACEAPGDKNLICRIQGSCGDIMPTSGPMPSVTIQIIEDWKLQGYLEN
jgi:hypothetical protein